MLFYRSNRGTRDLPLQMVRTCSAVSLLSYPTGALTLALGPDGPGTSILGYGLILLAVISFAPLTGSSIQRIVGEEVRLLDEFELRLRGRAMGLAHASFTALAMLGVMYAAIAGDTGGWLPESYEDFNGVFWGIFLYASVLPTAILSWIVDASFYGN